MKTSTNGRAIALLTLGLAMHEAAAVIIDFQGAPLFPGNGFTLSGVTFTDTDGSDLSVFDGGYAGFGDNLHVLSDDFSSLLMTFGGPIASFGITFGNDQEDFTSPGDTAVLLLYDGSTLFQTISMPLNRNSLMDQTLTWTSTGTAATSAEFYYGDASLSPISLTEVVDNVTYEPVPEPSTYAAVAFVGAVAAGAWYRRRRS